MRKMIALKDFPYGLDHRKAGDEIDVHDHDAVALEHVGLARVKGGRPANYQTKVMTATRPSVPVTVTNTDAPAVVTDPAVVVTDPAVVVEPTPESTKDLRA